eukprot:Cvel_20149.t1-p1 / transcript=Cvel_20149.t1 / gene=Cvel_20149 / organism=Chromera_velia_CCMP2878 / gene_product=hypothetical protein / transcript_product=hypothetical protein / location=Cvel_scaffold1788:30954-35220(+) / protein_length=423 / sequence_SO=supercontig / SO=protein_coding / is_pseudo=false
MSTANFQPPPVIPRRLVPFGPKVSRSSDQHVHFTHAGMGKASAHQREGRGINKRKWFPIAVHSGEHFGVEGAESIKKKTKDRRGRIQANTETRHPKGGRGEEHRKAGGHLLRSRLVSSPFSEADESSGPEEKSKDKGAAAAKAQGAESAPSASSSSSSLRDAQVSSVGKCEFDLALRCRKAQKLPESAARDFNQVLSRRARALKESFTAVQFSVQPEIVESIRSDESFAVMRQKIKELLGNPLGAGADLEVRQLTDPLNPAVAMHLLSGEDGPQFGLFYSETAPKIKKHAAQWLAHFGGTFSHDKEEEDLEWDTAVGMEFREECLTKKDKENWPVHKYQWDAARIHSMWSLSASRYATKAAFMNDYRVPKRIRDLPQMRNSRYHTRRPNCVLRKVFICGWPHVFLCSDELVASLGQFGEDLDK